MPTTLECRTISVSIDRSPREVYEFARVLENLPKWATGLGTGGERVGEVWVTRMEEGTVEVRFVRENDLGVLDHYVRLGPETEVYNPMRVVANGDGSEISFTLFQQPGVSDTDLETDAATVTQDLRRLKALLEDS